jgi:hypothetical protein
MMILVVHPTNVAVCIHTRFVKVSRPGSTAPTTNAANGKNTALRFSRSYSRTINSPCIGTSGVIIPDER